MKRKVRLNVSPISIAFYICWFTSNFKRMTLGLNCNNNNKFLAPFCTPSTVQFSADSVPSASQQIADEVISSYIICPLLGDSFSPAELLLKTYARQFVPSLGTSIVHSGTPAISRAIRASNGDRKRCPPLRKYVSYRTRYLPFDSECAHA